MLSATGPLRHVGALKQAADTMTACNLWVLLRSRSHPAEDRAATLLPLYHQAATIIDCQAALSPTERVC